MAIFYTHIKYIHFVPFRFKLFYACVVLFALISFLWFSISSERMKWQKKKVNEKEKRCGGIRLLWNGRFDMYTFKCAKQR